MEESMKKLMHNLELLVVLTGNRNWVKAADTVRQTKLVLGEIERDVDRRLRSAVEAELAGG